MSTQLDQIAKKAKSNPKLRFTSLAHLLTPEFLTETWKQMNRRGAGIFRGNPRFTCPPTPSPGGHETWQIRQLLLPKLPQL